MYAYIVVALLTGAHTEERRALTWDHAFPKGRPEFDPPQPPHIALLVFSSAVGKPLDAANVRPAFRQALKDIDGISADEWTPRELRRSFVSLLSDRGVTLGEISRLVGHSGTAVTEELYRKQIRPVIQTGAVVMDGIFQQGPERESRS
ncbi:hypothetical protein GCM10010321_78800 [Streptomyces chartreusis]|nr:hypothetical protein CP983_19590 [Streptomyces chartreusis]GGX50027.1 hypothetical protein GCM10010321_78800 [Streptomyces chartreusis]